MSNISKPSSPPPNDDHPRYPKMNLLLHRNMPLSCDNCISKYECEGQVCARCIAQNLPCTFSASKDRLRFTSLKKRSLPLYFPAQGSAYSDRMSLSLRVNHPAGPPKHKEILMSLPPDAPSAKATPISGFYTQWDEHEETTGFDDVPNELLDAIHWFAAHYYTTELSLRTMEDYPWALTKTNPYAIDMFYGLDGSALIALGILLIEILKEVKEDREEQGEVNEVTVGGPLDDYLTYYSKSKNKHFMHTSLITPRNYYTRHYMHNAVQVRRKIRDQIRMDQEKGKDFELAGERKDETCKVEEDVFSLEVGVKREVIE